MRRAYNIFYITKYITRALKIRSRNSETYALLSRLRTTKTETH